MNKGSLCWGSFGDLKKKRWGNTGATSDSVHYFSAFHLYCFSIKSWIQAGGCGGKTEFGCAVFVGDILDSLRKSCEMLFVICHKICTILHPCANFYLQMVVITVPCFCYKEDIKSLTNLMIQIKLV